MRKNSTLQVKVLKSPVRLIQRVMVPHCVQRLEDLAESSQELFGLLCRLLGAACRCPLPALQQLLADEIGWLKHIRVLYSHSICTQALANSSINFFAILCIVPAITLRLQPSKCVNNLQGCNSMGSCQTTIMSFFKLNFAGGLALACHATPRH